MHTVSKEKKEPEAVIAELRRELEAVLERKHHDLLLELESFCRFAQDEGYLDTDWYVEEPTLINRYLEARGQ